MLATVESEACREVALQFWLGKWGSLVQLPVWCCEAWLGRQIQLSLSRTHLTPCWGGGP